MITNIQIKSCKDPLLWYADKIDQVLDVIEYDPLRKVYLVATHFGANIVYDEDCKPWDLVTAYTQPQSPPTVTLNDLKYDSVTKPAHYNTGSVECIEGLEAALTPEEFQGYLKGNAMKYLWRCNHKGNKKQDLDKAQWYLQRLIGKQ
jgi:hypothetical protein